jgi:copper transport protein
VRALLVVIVAALAWPGAALAHATLLSSQPAAGAALARSPLTVRLVFDDTVRPGPGVAAVRNGGGSMLAGQAQTSGRVETIPLRPSLPDGVYSVRWSVISDDGHLIQGVLAFRVGAGGPAAAALAVQGGDRAARVAARWAFLLGVLLAGGVTIFRLAVGRSSRDGALLAGGFALALAGGAAALALEGSTATRYATSLEVGLGVAAAGLALSRTRLAEPLALGLLAVPTVSGHALDPGRSWLEVPADLLHVAAAATWLGGLASLALAPRLARRFSPLALAAVLGLGATGIVRAVGELSRVHQLWTTGYGRALLVKTGLLAALLALGSANRRRLLRRVLAAELALLALLIATVGFLTDARPGRQPAAVAAPAPSGEPPLPPPGALVLAREDGPWGVALAVRGHALITTVTGQDGNGVDGLTATLDGVPARPCGHGCYQATVRRLPRRLVERLGSTRVVFELPAHWRPAPELVRWAGAAFRSLRSVEFVERLASDSQHRISTRWIERAPDRLRYQIAGGATGIVIGARRWDRLPGGPWTSSVQTPLRLPALAWARVADANLIAATPSTWTVSFLDPSFRAWFLVRIDRRTYRPLALDMVATAHFMHHEYSAWNAAPPVRPPR